MLRQSTIMLGLAAALLLASPLAAAPEPAGQSILGTPEQLAAERLAMRIAASPQVTATQATIRAKLLEDPVSKTPDGKAGLDRAIDRWTMALILEEIGRARTMPAAVLATEDMPRTWFGHTFPGSSVAVGNPDNVYRSAFLDGAARYEVTGRVPPNPAAQATFELQRRPEIARISLAKQSSQNGDMGHQLQMLSSEQLQVRPDGTFTITIDSDPANGRPNHMRAVTGPLQLYVRNSLSDWSQQPYPVHIRRLSGPTPAPVSEAELIRRTVEHMPGFIGFWADFKDHWLGLPAPNTVAGPYRRAGGWGWSAAGRFSLKPDEALVMTITAGDASYESLQTTDPWMMTPNARLHQTTLNLSQSRRNPDGAITYVLANTDPGVANWIDLQGLSEGWYQVRWQGFRTEPKGPELMRDFRVVKLADLAAALPPGTPRLTPDERRAQVAARDASYGQRYSARLP